jgi:hypothetical protein
MTTDAESTTTPAATIETDTPTATDTPVLQQFHDPAGLWMWRREDGSTFIAPGPPPETPPAPEE